MRDESDLSGLKLHHRPQAGGGSGEADAEVNGWPPLQDTFSRNFNILIAGMPRVLGSQGPAGGVDCMAAWSVCGGGWASLAPVEGEAASAAGLEAHPAGHRQGHRHHPGDGGGRGHPQVRMIGFGIDEKQAEYVAEIKLRNINKEYILKRVQETERLAGRDPGSGGHLGKACCICRIMVEEAYAGTEEVRPAPENRDHLQPRGAGYCRRSRWVTILSPCSCPVRGISRRSRPAVCG